MKNHDLSYHLCNSENYPIHSALYIDLLSHCSVLFQHPTVMMVLFWLITDIGLEEFTTHPVPEEEPLFFSTPARAVRRNQT